MFGYNGNSVNIADSILNSLEIEKPFLSFDSEKYHYYISFYFNPIELIFTYNGNSEEEEEMLSKYWDEATVRVKENLKNYKENYDINEMPYEIFIDVINTILKEMDGVNK